MGVSGERLALGTGGGCPGRCWVFRLEREAAVRDCQWGEKEDAAARPDTPRPSFDPCYLALVSRVAVGYGLGCLLAGGAALGADGDRGGREREVGHGA